MSQIIQIQDINSSDTLKTMVEKINYNFDQIMAFGGGPKGEMGQRGFIGPDGEPGEQGERGNLITVVDSISTVGDNLKVGDLAIYSNNQYIYKVEEIDGEKHFVSTNICIKGDAGEAGLSESPFGYNEEDAIVTIKNGTDVPKYTFIGTDKIIGGNIGNLNVVGSDGIHIFTPTDNNDNNSDNGYCGKIYGYKLGSENILVLSGEDNPDNYVKIDNTLLTDKIHSSDNDIKIAEFTNDGIVLGDKSNNTSIECNEFAVKNGSNTQIKTSSSNINLKGNLYVNNNDYNYTTKICGRSIDIETEDNNLGKSTHIQANSNDGVIISRKDKNARKKESSISIIDDRIRISANNITIGKTKYDNDIQIYGHVSVYGNSSIDGYATAIVNGVSDVYLGCPIGTVVMWAGKTIPDGWLLCDGTGIPVYPVYQQNNKPKYISKECTIQGKQLVDDELTELVFKVFKKDDAQTDSLYGRANYCYVDEHGWVKDGKYGENYVSFTINEYTKDVKEAYKFYKGGIQFTDSNGNNIDTTSYQCINLPDFQQKFPLGAKTGTINTGWGDKQNTESTSLGSKGGESEVYLCIQTMPKHSHTLNRELSPYNAGAWETTENSYNTKNGYTTDLNYILKVNESGDSKPHNNMPPFLSINFIIKYK